jgi:hypothetical protein
LRPGKGSADSANFATSGTTTRDPEAYMNYHSSPARPEYLLTVADLAARWRLKPKTIRNRRTLGTLPPAIKGGQLLFRLDDVEAWEQARLSVNTAKKGGN